MLIKNYGVIALLFSVGVSSVTFAQLSTSQPVAGEYIVKFKNKSAAAGNLRAVGKMNSVSVKAVFSDSKMMHVKVSSEAGRDALYANPDVEFIEPNYILSVNPVDVSAMGSAPEPTDSYAQSNANVRVKDSWAIQKPYDQGTKTIVAVIDTGLDKNHLLFKDSGGLWENTAEKNGQTGVDDDGNGYVDDINGWNFVNNNSNFNDDNDHGTHVAGIILGVGQDVLANPVRESKVKIMPLKFLDASGAGTTASAVSAIYYAIAKGARVINNSWGGPSYSQSLHEAYAYAYSHNVIIVSAAGNSNTNNDSSPMYPANLDSPNNISVLASTDSDNKASFSNFGSATVQVAAPGVAILSSVPGTGCISPGCFQMMSGTSMAAPFVAGLAALVVREAPQLSAYQVRAIVLGTIDSKASLSGKISTAGRVNSFSAITSAKTQTGVASWSPAYTPNYKANRSTASDTSEAVAAPAGCGLVKAVADSSSANFGDGIFTQDLMMIFALLLLPLIVAVNLKQKIKHVATANRRLFDRFSVSKNAVLEVCGQIINITTEDISLGGISFKSDATLSKGQIVQVDLGAGNSEKISAEVVWCAKKNEYGLKFINITEAIKYEIESWTQGLIPTV